MIGLALLLIGRQLFWVAIAGLGFILGFSYVGQYYQGSTEVILLISLGIGAIGAILAYALQRTAALLLGFMAGWYLTISLVNYIELNTGYTVIFAVAGGLIGLGLVSALFDWSLIVLSSLSGAALITQSISYQANIKTGIFVVLLTLGIAVQGFMFMQEGEQYRG
jgi:hypothetical protein